MVLYISYCELLRFDFYFFNITYSFSSISIASLLNFVNVLKRYDGGFLSELVKLWFIPEIFKLGRLWLVLLFSDRATIDLFFDRLVFMPEPDGILRRIDILLTEFSGVKIEPFNGDIFEEFSINEFFRVA